MYFGLQSFLCAYEMFSLQKVLLLLTKISGTILCPFRCVVRTAHSHIVEDRSDLAKVRGLPTISEIIIKSIVDQREENVNLLLHGH